MNMQKELDMSVISEEVLDKLNAREDDKEWWLLWVGESFKVKNLKLIKGDYKGYIRWIKAISHNRTYDKYGNLILYKYSEDDKEIFEYDSNGNILSYKDSNGIIITKKSDIVIVKEDDNIICLIPINL